jgi:hypothetical protein
LLGFHENYWILARVVVEQAVPQVNGNWDMKPLAMVWLADAWLFLMPNRQHGGNDKKTDSGNPRALMLPRPKKKQMELKRHNDGDL